MNRTRRIIIAKAGLISLGVALLCACNQRCPTTEITTAVQYPGGSGFFGSSYDQIRQWIENPRLDRFLKKAIASDGIGSLSSKHGLQCVARSTPDGCADCYVCTGTVAAEEIDLTYSLFATGCTANGKVAIRAEIGPGDAARSMTYWEPRPSTRHE